MNIAKQHGPELATESWRQRKGLLFVVISAIGFGLLGIFARYAYDAGYNVTTVLSLRFTIAAVILWVVILVKKEKALLKISDLLLVCALGVLGYAVMAGCYFNSVKLVSPSITAIVLYTYPVIVTILSSLVFREKITRTKILALLLSFIGLALAVGVVYESLNVTGVMYAFGAAVVYSVFIISSSKLVTRVSPLVVTSYVVTAAAIALSIMGLVDGTLHFNNSPQGWWAIIGIALFSSVIGILGFFEGVKLVGPTKASIISTLEPLVTVAAAFLLFAERLTFLQLTGGALVITAVILIQYNAPPKEQFNELTKAS